MLEDWVKGEKMARRKSNIGWFRKLERAGESDLNGFRVEASDGLAGRIEQVLYWSDARIPDYIVIESGRWLFGRKSILSTGMIDEVDTEKRSLTMRMSKREIREVPECLPCT